MKTFKEFENIDEACEECIFEHELEGLQEAEYQGKKVKLNDPIRGGSKKFYVYVKNDQGNIVAYQHGSNKFRGFFGQPRQHLGQKTFLLFLYFDMNFIRGDKGNLHTRKEGRKDE